MSLGEGPPQRLAARLSVCEGQMQNLGGKEFPDTIRNENGG